MTDGSEALLYRAVVEYDGTDFLGFQIQAQGRTVQGVLEEALLRLTQRPVRVVGSGRTDAGVHAWGQVVAFRTAWPHSLSRLHRGLNAVLPDDIAIRTLEPAPSGFHPRFSADERWYRYQIGLWSGHSPLRARYAWEIGPDLDVEAMNRAATELVGTHDFATFGRAPQGENTVRTVTQAVWSKETPYLYFDIRANAFLQRMVRNLVATLVWVGQGKCSPERFRTLLRSRDRSRSAPPAPPQGLFLMAVEYSL
ncbi:MAG: tRNA pseudouridine(38-40) synthase TruA [Chloroflexi bacterium]|nr:tRNA pseudouridine(38-40) synthase TruA [Chloroflexota bacterium]